MIIENDEKLKHANSNLSASSLDITKSDVAILQDLEIKEEKPPIQKSQSWNAEKQQQKEGQEVSKQGSTSSIESDKEDPKTITQQLLDSDG